MKRKALGTAVVLAALAVLINVFALRTANVPNSMSLAIKTSDASLIAITAGSDSDVAFDATGGQAVLTIGGTFGVQPGSTYTFYPAFKVTNNSADAGPKDIAFSVPDTTADGYKLELVNSTGGALPATIAKGATIDVGIKISNVTSTSLGTTVTPEIVVIVTTP